MCELYLHSAPAPTADHPWLAEFLTHAAQPFDNPNGWGLAAFCGRDAQEFREAESAANSALASYISANPPRTDVLIAHLRAASSGAISLANTQPISRVVGHGDRVSRLVFVHNGSVADFMDSDTGEALKGCAIGSADSEIAFLRFTDFMNDRPLGDCVPDFHRFACEMAAIGPFNVIVSDGLDILVHSDIRKHQADGDDADFRGPGLYEQNDSRGHLVLTSEPLSDTTEPIPRGTSLHIRAGLILQRYSDAC